MKWKNKKEELEKLISEGKSYEEIGRKYGCSGANIKKTAIRLGINLPQRRKINAKETFNRGTAKTGFCENCGKEFVLYESTAGKYCSARCQAEFKYNDFIKKWKTGEKDGTVKGFKPSKYIRQYLFKKNNCKCEKCGWGEANEYTGKIPLQVHHINGNSEDNREKNLQLLCPNCHSLTENFGSRNKHATEKHN